MQVQQEDIALCEAVQRGLQTPAYNSGRCYLLLSSVSPRQDSICVKCQLYDMLLHVN